MERLRKLAEDRSLHWSKSRHELLAIDQQRIFFGQWCSETSLLGTLCYDPLSSQLEALGPIEVVKGILAGLCLLLEKSNLKRWKQLEARELENFLRTQNHKKAFEDFPEMEPLSREILLYLKKELLVFLLFDLCPADEEWDWSSRFTSRAERALLLQEKVFGPLSSEFGLDWELYNLKGESFIFKGELREDWVLSAIGNFVRHIFQRETLNIVAEDR